MPPVTLPVCPLRCTPYMRPHREADAFSLSTKPVRFILSLAAWRLVAITRHISNRFSLDMSTSSTNDRFRVCFQNHVSISAKNALARATHPISKKKTRNHVRPAVPIVHDGRERRRNEHGPMAFPRHKPKYMIHNRKRASKPSPRDYPTSPLEKVYHRLVACCRCCCLCLEPSIAVIVISLLGPSSTPEIVPSCRPVLRRKRKVRSTTRKDRRSVFRMYSTIAIRCL